MLDKILEEMISKDLVVKGIVDMDREDSLFTISTHKGSIGVKEEGKNWLVSYVSFPFEGDCEEIEYVKMPSSLNILPFDEALKTALGYLSIILPREYNENMNLN